MRETKRQTLGWILVVISVTVLGCGSGGSSDGASDVAAVDYAGDARTADKEVPADDVGDALLPEDGVPADGQESDAADVADSDSTETTDADDVTVPADECFTDDDCQLYPTDHPCFVKRRCNIDETPYRCEVDYGAVTWETVLPSHAVVTDFEQEKECCNQWFYTRIGSDRGTIGGGACGGEESCASLCCDQAVVDVPADWAGVWNALLHNSAAKDALDLSALLGPLVLPEWQVKATAVEMVVLSGNGLVKVELKDAGSVLLQEESAAISGPASLTFPIDVAAPVHTLNWVVSGPGQVVVDEVRLTLEGPEMTIPEALFLWSYAHLYQAYDPATGWVRDRARWPAADFAAVQSMGTFMLATALGADLGYLEADQAKAIVLQVRDALLAIPRHETGLLPHFITQGEVTPCTEFSSVDSVVAGTASILSCDIIGIDAGPVREMLASIDWALLCGNFEEPCSHGFVDPDCDGTWQLSQYAWSHFGSEAFLVCTALAAATGELCILEDIDPAQPLTDDGSGFNDLMVRLLLPMDGTDAWGVDWPAFRAAAICAQLTYPYGPSYEEPGLFGLSASEVPEPCCAPVKYGAWGAGGLTTGPNDGTESYGSVVIAPHYAAMSLAEFPDQAQRVWAWLMKEATLFTPMNNVESFTFGDDGQVRWNGVKSSWNLSLQALAAAQALYAIRQLPYPPHQHTLEDPFLGPGHETLMPAPR